MKTQDDLAGRSKMAANKVFPFAVVEFFISGNPILIMNQLNPLNILLQPPFRYPEL